MGLPAFSEEKSEAETEFRPRVAGARADRVLERDHPVVAGVEAEDHRPRDWEADAAADLAAGADFIVRADHRRRGGFRVERAGAAADDRAGGEDRVRLDRAGAHL